jgi:hypothetical protein
MQATYILAAGLDLGVFGGASLDGLLKIHDDVSQ